uniref:Uncharacterized protein n=1 Tax=Rhizophora mucronata TaxID=61149 RepID=A0A2P2NHM5_RHIMU
MILLIKGKKILVCTNVEINKGFDFDGLKLHLDWYCFTLQSLPTNTKKTRIQSSMSKMQYLIFGNNSSAWQILCACISC